jgi:hypothetical protein
MNSAKIIHIWQGERHDNALKFMYKPIIISLQKIVKEIYPLVEIDVKINYYNYNEIKPHDVLIWVGCINVPNFDYLKNRNIYTVYYNTEPLFDNMNSNEIWTYSKFMFHNYNKNNNIIKFVPIICEYNIPFISYNNNNMQLIFLGHLNYRIEKKNKLLNSSFIKNNLIEIYNIWNDDDYNNLITSKPNIYLNLLKSGTNALTSVRVNKLLSHKCIIISEHTNDLDDELYKDIIYFCDINNIENVFNELLNKSALELQEISNNIYENFSNKFNPKNIINLLLEK